MIKFSLSSHHRFLRFFLRVVIWFFILITFVNVFFTVLLNKKLIETQRSAVVSSGYSLGVRFAYFNVFNGVTLMGLECARSGHVLFSARSLDLGFDVMSLFNKQVRVKNITCKQARITSAQFSDLIVLLRQFFGYQNKTFGLYQTTYFDGADITLDDNLADIKGYISFVKDDLYISRGTLLIKRIGIPAFSDVDIFQGSSIYKSFGYVFEWESKNSDFQITRFELSNPSLKFSGSGHIDMGLPLPKVIFEMDLLNIILDDFLFLNSDHLKSRGVIDATLKISGPVDDLKIFMNAKIVNAEFSLFDSFLLQKVNGSVLLAKDHLVGQNFSLSINGMPFVADFAFFNKGQPHLLLQLFSQEKTAVFPAFVLNLSGDWINNELNVDAKSRLHFGSKGTKSVLDIGFKNLRLGFEDNLFFDAQALDAGLTVTSVDARKEEKIFDRKVTLEHPYSVLRREEDGFVLDNIEATCYDGALEGQTRFIYKNDHLDVKGEAHLKDVDLKKFFQESRVNEYTLSGKLTGDFRFDTTLVDMIKGQIFINDGLIEQNPLLNTVSNFLGVASLKKINFDDLTMFFSGGRGDYASQVKLQSPQVTALLDGRVSGYDKMDGFLTISLSTQLLNESKQFKKILTYIKHDEPSVIFPFKIFSYINSPRVLWLKNEFKVKLQNLIPESNKRFLQRQVNGMVEKIDGE